MILGIQNQKGRKYWKMQGMQICDDTGVEDKQWEATKIQRDTNIENARNTNMGWYWKYKIKRGTNIEKCKGCKYAMILGRKTNSGRRLADRRDWVDKLQCILSEMVIITSSWSWWLNHHIMSMIMIIIMIMIIKIQTRCNSACQRRWWLQYLSIWWWSWWFKLK